MLAGQVSLHDIEDVEAFVKAAIKGVGLKLRGEEYTDLVAEGLVILYELADNFNGKGRFSGYAAKYLRLRILTAWRQGKPNHWRGRTEPGGKREWHAFPEAVSFDEIIKDESSHGHNQRVEPETRLQIDPSRWVRAEPTSAAGA